MLRNSADTHCSKLVIPRVNNVGGTQSFISWLLPLRNKCCIDNFVNNTVIVQFFGNAAVGIIQIVDVSCLLPVYLMDRPLGLVLTEAFVWFVNL